MTKQVIFYERAVPVSKQQHAAYALEAGQNYQFARETNSVPLMAVEFPHAAAEYTIVFAGDENAVMPVVILGVQGDKNLFVADDGSWDARYVPAFVRRYPFVFSSTDNGNTFTLCLDESFEGWNQEGRGQRLFDDEGNSSEYLDGILTFLQEYQAQFQRTAAFCERLKKFDLLEPAQAQVKLRGGSQISLTGFMAINREKVKALSGEQLTELAKTDELELIYTHLTSMSGFSAKLDRLAGRLVPEDGAPDTAPPAAPAKGKKKVTKKASA
jgi:hypothetical protein